MQSKGHSRYINPPLSPSPFCCIPHSLYQSAAPFTAPLPRLGSLKDILAQFNSSWDQFQLELPTLRDRSIAIEWGLKSAHLCEIESPSIERWFHKTNRN